MDKTAAMARPSKLTPERADDLAAPLAARVPPSRSRPGRSTSPAGRSTAGCANPACVNGSSRPGRQGPRRRPTRSPRRRLVDPRAFVARVEWRTARTVENFPHAYYVQPKDDAEEFFAFVTLINREGEPRSFGKTRYRYLEVGEHVYWVSRSWYDRGALIVNRRLAADDQGARFDGTNYA